MLRSMSTCAYILNLLHTMNRSSCHVFAVNVAFSDALEVRPAHRVIGVRRDIPYLLIIRDRVLRTLSRSHMTRMTVH